MGVVITWVVSLVLAVVTVALAMSHNRPFDFVGDRSARRWWLCQFGINTERRRWRSAVRPGRR